MSCSWDAGSRMVREQARRRYRWILTKANRALLWARLGHRYGIDLWSPDHRDELLQIEWYKEKSVDNLMTAIEAKRTLPYRPIYWCTRNPMSRQAYSETPSRRSFIVRMIFSIFISASRRSKQWRISVQEQQGRLVPILRLTSISLSDSLPAWQSYFQKLSRNPLASSGKNFCVTGTFDTSRDDIHAMVEANGGKYALLSLAISTISSQEKMLKQTRKSSNTRC